jgi:translocation and assembly module TamB
MSNGKRKFTWMHGFGLGVLVSLTVGAALVLLIVRGVADEWARRTIVQQLERATGARVELKDFRIGWRVLRARLDGLTLHGKEPEGTPPLFHADQLQVEIHVESFWGRKISLGRVVMSHFSAHMRVERDGSTNFPGPKVQGPPGALPVQRAFDLKVANLRLADGELLWNDIRVPVVAETRDFEFAMEYAPENGRPVYVGRVGSQNLEVAARRYLPFPSDVTAKFIFRPDSFSLTQLRWRMPHSEIEAQAEVASFSRQEVSFKYRGQVSFDDMRSILRKPNTPEGHAEFSGQGRYAGKQFSYSGRYTADGIVMPYPWFHAEGISSRGAYGGDQRALDAPNFEASALGGKLAGHLHFDIPSQQFRVDSQARGLDLGQALAATDQPEFPVLPLHWGGRVDVDSTTTWFADFQHLESRGVSLWSSPGEPAPGKIPVTARFDYHYVMDRMQVELAPSEITTPTSHVAVRGALSTVDSSLELTFDTEDISTWKDFINRLRGSVDPHLIGGRAHWQGRITGPLTSPVFAGHAKAEEARYGDLYWDEMEGEISYSVDDLHVTRGRARRGRSSADVELSLVLDHWGYSSENKWSFDVNLVGADTDDLQKLLGISYPVRGLLTGRIQGSGTPVSPELSSLFDATDVAAWTWRFDRARGQLTLRNNEVRIANAELRLPASAAGAPAGLLTGNFLYRLNTHDITFDLTGAAIPLESIARIQTAALPVAGRLNLQIRGQGPLTAPELHGTLRAVDLKLGGEVLGSFEGSVDSDGHRLSATIESAMPAGHLAGKVDVTLGGDYAIVGEVTAQQIDFDPIIIAALHLTGLTGHSHTDGHFAIAGFGAHPETLSVEANLSRVNLDYDYVKIENDGPVRLTYRRDEVRLEQAKLRGTDTDFQVSGFARFAGDRAVQLRVDGAMSLQLVAGFVPHLEANGRAQINAGVVGTLTAPRFNGKIHVEGATARYGDFPAGLSNLTGDFNFDAARMAFENVTAESGGGHLSLGGTVAYGEGQLSYTLTANSEQVRIRYPAGMSWLGGGTVRLSGNAQSATLSGRIAMDRLLMTQGADLAGFVSAASEPVTGPSTTLPFLRNLQFDIQADSTPDSRMEWAGARVQTDASLRLRGTWEHPILLGHIHLLSGEMTFRGNRYTIARGDINFANPFRLDPVLNVEAATTIRQYGVTLDFSGPASRLTLAYRSDPPLPSSDIIALLALGSTSSESTQRTATGQAPEAGASTLLSEAISSQLGGRIERLFGISHFRVDPFVAGPTSGQTAIARVTIEQQVTRGLVITYISDVTSSQRQVIQIEYAVSQEYSVIALRDENGTFGLDVIRKTRFK